MTLLNPQSLWALKFDHFFSIELLNPKDSLRCHQTWLENARTKWRFSSLGKSLTHYLGFSSHVELLSIPWSHCNPIVIQILQILQFFFPLTSSQVWFPHFQPGQGRSGCLGGGSLGSGQACQGPIFREVPYLGYLRYKWIYIYIIYIYTRCCKLFINEIKNTSYIYIYVNTSHLNKWDKRCPLYIKMLQVVGTNEITSQT